MTDSARLSTRSLVDVLYEDVIPRLKVYEVYEGLQFVASGHRYWRARCPLHKGQDANFSINVQTLTWTCFSHCGHGSVVTYLNGGLPASGERFREIVADLAQRAGVAIEWKATPDSPEVQRRLRRQEILEGFAVVTQRELAGEGGTPAVNFLALRGFPVEPPVISKLGLGFLPTSTNLQEALKATASELSAEGLSDPRWRSRVIIPWRNASGRVATFLGRAITSNADPRYLYLRGAEIPPFFGLHQIRSGQTETMLVVESPLDALLLMQHGVDNVVAVGSTTMTLKHLDVLRRFAVRALVLALDNDRAGQDAIQRFLTLAKKELPNLRLSVVPPEAFHGAKDPGDFLVSASGSSILGLLDQRVPAAMYEGLAIVRGVAPTAAVAVRRDALDRISRLAHSLAGPERLADVEDLVGMAIPRLGYPEFVIRDALGAPSGSTRQPDTSKSESPGRVQALLEAVYRGPLPERFRPPTDEEMWSVVDDLEERLAFVLSARYGRLRPSLTLDEVAAALATVEGRRLSRERIRQLETKALRRLRSQKFRPRLLGVLKPLPPAQGRPPANHGAFGTRAGSKAVDASSSAVVEDSIATSSQMSTDEIVQSLTDIAEPISVIMLTHVLRGSRGPATAELVRRRSPRHVGVLRQMSFGEARDLIERTCRSDPRIVIVERLVSLAAVPPPLSQPTRHGKSWSNDERRALIRGWAAGQTVDQLAASLERTSGGVTSALVQLGLVDSPEQAQERVERSGQVEADSQETMS